MALRGALASIAIAAGASCAPPPPPPPFHVNLTVESDPGMPLEGAQVFSRGKVVGVTGPTGVAALSLAGAEGTTFDFSIQCPEGYKSPLTPLTVLLRRLGSAATEYKARCFPLMRTAVVAIDADKGPNLPVVYLGREVARTDESGAASVLLSVTPGEEFTVTLSTQDKAAQALRPQNPSVTFRPKDQDDLFVFSEQFTLPKAAVVVPRPVGPSGPTKIGLHKLH